MCAAANDRHLVEAGSAGSEVDVSLQDTGTYLPGPASVGPDEIRRRQPPQCGRYRLDEPIGRGGFGEVWRAFDPELRRNVAIKLIRRDRTASAAPCDQLIAEGQKLAQLRHPGIVSIFDAGRSSNGSIYIVSELIAGSNLAQRLQSENLAPRDAAVLVSHLAAALQYAHLRGLVHRDIKPANVLFDRDGTPRIVDFGLAVTEVEQLAECSGVVGTLPYMSPEQIRGDSHLVDCRSDIYSLGIVFYQLLTGRLPFVAVTREQWSEQIQFREPRPLRTINEAIPPALESICLRCLCKRIPDRYPTAADLVADLQRFLERRSILPVRTLMLATVLACLAYGAYALAPKMRDHEGPSLEFSSPAADGSNAPSSASGHDSASTAAEKLEDMPAIDLRSLLSPHPSDFPVSGWNVTEHNVLNVASTGRTLLSFGSHDDGELHLRIEMLQIDWAGRMGILFGFQPAADGEHTRYHVLQIYRRTPSQYELRSSMYVFRSSNSAGVHEEFLVSQVPLQNFQQNSNTLELSLRAGVLAEVRFNGELIDEIVSRHNKFIQSRRTNCNGAFGTFNLHSSGMFLRLRIDGHPVRIRGTSEH